MVSNVLDMPTAACPSEHSAVFEKEHTSGKWGLHFQPVLPEVHPVASRETHGHSLEMCWVQIPGLQRVAAPSAAGGQRCLGAQRAGPVWHTGNCHKPGSAHTPCSPQGPLGIPHGHPHCWLGLAPFFWHLFCWPTGGGGVPAPKGQNNDFRRSGGNQGSMGLERCGPGSPMDPSDGPIASLVERDTLMLTLFGPPHPPLPPSRSLSMAWASQLIGLIASKQTNEHTAS